jgi:EAL and modified HD-GYP domain-containing signal transduction protein
MGLTSVTGATRAWVNVSRSFLLETDLSVLPPERVVIELLERNVLDAAYVAKVAALATEGYQLALDDFTWDEEMLPLLDLVTYVKLDLRALGTDGVADHVRRLAPYGVRIVAEKVETAEERDTCLDLGIDLFQGYFFEKPRLVRGRPAPHAALRRLRIATSLGAGGSFEEVERIVHLDPGLSVRLLRYINSAAVALRNRVSSIRQAMMLVGADTVRQWILLVLLGDLGRVKPAVLVSGLQRARICEQLARTKGIRGAESAFAVGLLSICDALLDAEIGEVMETLPLTPDVKDAIGKRQGPLGQLLSRAIVLQHGDAKADPKEARVLAEALLWADAQLAEFTSA